ncbi:MAG TPA: aminotransferase class IV [Sphingobacteriaceae bacterium]
MDHFSYSAVVFVNGEFIRAEDVKVDVYSKTLHYGYGAFEGIRAYDTRNGVRIFKAKDHYERLKRSCGLVKIPDIWDNDDLITQTYRLLEINDFKNAYIRAVVLYGHQTELIKPVEASIMIFVSEWSTYLGEKLLRMCVSNYQRPNSFSIKAEAKITGYYINSILAADEAHEKGFDDALLLDVNNQVAQAPRANFFLEKNGCLFTPPVGNILPGITRKTVIELCRMFEIEVFEQHLSISDITAADSAFLCGTSAEIIGIKSVDETVFPMDWSDSLGSTLQRAYKNLVLEKENYEIII